MSKASGVAFGRSMSPPLRPNSRAFSVTVVNKENQCVPLPGTDVCNRGMIEARITGVKCRVMAHEIATSGSAHGNRVRPHSNAVTPWIFHPWMRLRWRY